MTLICSAPRGPSAKKNPRRLSEEDPGERAAAGKKSRLP
uniref:Uncharacterized protein n=1 Tax=Anguilla anguilla TaxID=7936 RepID=A0A0E9QA34_ANGAN